MLKWQFLYLWILCVAIRLSALLRAPEGACTDYELLRSWLNSYRCHCIMLVQIYYPGEGWKESKSAPGSVSLAFLFYYVCFCCPLFSLPILKQTAHGYETTWQGPFFPFLKDDHPLFCKDIGSSNQFRPLFLDHLLLKMQNGFWLFFFS